MPKETRSYYAFRDTKTGQLARLYGSDYQYRLVRDEQWPIFEVETSEALALVLFENTPGYNTSPQVPGWGEFRGEELEPVKVTATVEMDAIALPPILSFKTISVRDIPYVLARKYAGGDFDPRPDLPGLVFWLVELPDGETVETLRDTWTHKVVFGGDRYTRRHVYACVPVPEDYGDLLKGKAGALLIASSSFYL